MPDIEPIDEEQTREEIGKIQTNLRNRLDNIRSQTSTNRNFFARVSARAIAPVLWLWRLIFISRNPILKRLSEEEKIVKFTQLIFESLLNIGKLLDKKGLLNNLDDNSNYLNGVADILRQQPYHRVFDILLLQLSLRKSIGNTECAADANSVKQINDVQASEVAATHELPYKTVVLLCLLMEPLKKVIEGRKQGECGEDIQEKINDETTPLLNNFNDEAIRNGVIAFLWNCRELMQPLTRGVADVATIIFGGSCYFQVKTGLNSLIPNAALRGTLAGLSSSANIKVYYYSTRRLLSLKRLFPGDSILPVLSVHIDERWIRRPANKLVLIPAIIVSAGISLAYTVLAVQGIKESEKNVASWGDYLQDAIFGPVTMICMTGVQAISIVDKLQNYFLHRKLKKVNQQSALEVLPNHDHSSGIIKCVTTLTRVTIILPVVGVDAMMTSGYSPLVKKVPPTLAIGASISLLMSPFNYYNMKNFWMFVVQHIESCGRNLGRCYKGSVHREEEVGPLNNVNSLYDFIVLWAINPFNNASIAVLSKEDFIKLINSIRQMSPHTEDIVGKSIKVVLFITGFSTSEMFSMCPYDRTSAMLIGFDSCCDAIAKLQHDQVMQRTLRRNGDTAEYPSSSSQSSDVSINVAPGDNGFVSSPQILSTPTLKEPPLDKDCEPDDNEISRSKVGKSSNFFLPESSGSNRIAQQEPQLERQIRSWGERFRSWCPCFWRSGEGSPLLSPGDSSVQSDTPSYGAC
ncbi:MAG: hypothetical protein AMJ43_04665 [Coxiella sp. DG_40]|nr:MAG: hypothetical protein AMJ43_04665 [Coxiella sp. DG_40]